MYNLNHQYYATLLEEQRLKQCAFDEQIQLELLDLIESAVTKNKRHEYMKYLANRILQINVLLEPWLDTIELNWTVGSQ